VDKAKVSTAWEEGHVADADIPDTARKPEGEEAAEKPKKKATKKAAKKKDEDAEEGDEDEDEEPEEKPKKKTTKKAAKKADVDEDGEGEVSAEKPKKAKATKKVWPSFHSCTCCISDTRLAYSQKAEEGEGEEPKKATKPRSKVPEPLCRDHSRILNCSNRKPLLRAMMLRSPKLSVLPRRNQANLRTRKSLHLRSALQRKR
jgi:hypothetical protein